MTPREPDRFVEQARALQHAPVLTIAAALRQAADDALERAAQDFDQEAERLEQDARKLDADGQGMAAAAHFHDARVAEANANRIRALASPAAAPAAETVRCMCPPGAVAGSCPLRNDVQSICECRCHGAPPSEPVAPAAPAAPEKEIANLLGRGHVRNPREGEPGDAETYSSPAPLLPRVLAALEDRGEGCHLTPGRARALAAELRAYIAKAKGEGT